MFSWHRTLIQTQWYCKPLRHTFALIRERLGHRGRFYGLKLDFKENKEENIKSGKIDVV